VNDSIPTGIPALDRAASLIAPGRVTIIAARPSMGKTSLARAITFHASERHQILVASLEEEPAFFNAKIACLAAGVDSRKYSEGWLSADERSLLVSQVGIVAERKITYCESYALSVASLRVALKRLELSGAPPPAVILIDYLQLMAHPKSAESRQYAVAETTRELKLLALEAKLSVVCLSQLNRNVEGREDARPRLSDLRESGAIEQDADSVVFIWSDSAWAAPSSSPVTRRNLTIAKNRQGPTGEVGVLFDRASGRFSSVEGG
jgi:replicative DNA helicase